MNTWILLVLLLCSCSGSGNAQQNNSCRNIWDGGSGMCRERGNGRERDNDCGCDCGRERGNDCDGNDSRFEPRFDARPFGGGETCGCEEKND